MLKLSIDVLNSIALNICIDPSSEMFVFVSFKSLTLQFFDKISSATTLAASSPTSNLVGDITVTIKACNFVLELVLNKDYFVVR